MIKAINGWLASLLSVIALATTLNGATLHGKVYDAATSDSRGIPGARIDVTFKDGSRSTTTAADGTYAVDDLPKDAKVTASYIADGYQVHPTVVQVDLATASTQDIPMAREVDNVGYFETLAGSIHKAELQASGDKDLLAQIAMRLPPENRQVVDRALEKLNDRRFTDPLRPDARRARLEAEFAKIASTRSESRGVVVTLSGFLFDTGKARLKPQADETLAKIANELKSDSELKVTVEGHTDNVGGQAKNEQLSDLRANAVRMFLVQAGVAADRIIAVGKGEGDPVATNKTAAGRSQNRRVELIIQ